MNPIFRTDSYCNEIKTILDFIEEHEGKQLLSFRDSLFTQGGGQPRDYGKVIFENEEREVLELVKHKGDIRIKIDPIITLRKSVEVLCKLDFERRKKIMRLHSAQHALAGALNKITPDYVSKGMQIKEDLSSCEMHFLTTFKMDQAVIEDAKSMVLDHSKNQRKIWAESINSIDLAKEKFKTIFRPGDPDIQIKGKVRMIIIEELDANPCGGTHLKNLSEMGQFQDLELVDQKNHAWALQFSLE